MHQHACCTVHVSLRSQIWSVLAILCSIFAFIETDVKILGRGGVRGGGWGCKFVVMGRR